MKNRYLKIFLAVLAFAFSSILISSYSTYGAPVEFGNNTTTTVYIGGDLGELNASGSAKFDGNVTASWFKGLFNWSIGDLFATFDGSTWLQNVSKINQTIDERIAVTYYNATSIDIIAGTNNTADLSLLQIYNGQSYNISEAAGTPALDVRINFTGVDDFNQVVIRMKTTSGGRHRYKIQIYDYAEVIWEDYTNFVEVDTFKVMDLGVYDPTDHISGELVQVRFYLDETGIPAHELFLDWISLSDGPATFSTSEIDPLSFHIGENLNNTDYNITADYFSGSYLNSTGALEWIRPEHIFDVDDADIETDLNTYWDIAGDSDSGSYLFNFTNSNLTMNYYFGNGSQLSDIVQAEADPYWSSNYTAYNSSWSSITNASYYLISNPFGFYNSTNPQTEIDPYWSANQSSYSTTAEILAFGYYNATDFVITDYFTKSNILGFGYYNSTDFDIADYFTSSEVLAFNYYNSSDFDIADYFTSAEVLGFSYYNSTDFSISDYSTTAAILGWSYYNVTSFPDNYLLNTGDTASGNYTFDSTTLHIDSTNNRVGIGITSPEKLLHLNGTNPELRISSDSDAGYSILRFGDSSGVLNYILQYDRNHATHPGKLRIEMSSRDFIITGTGNVGIGTTSPGATLDVDGAIRAIGTMNPASGTGLEMHHTDGTSYLISYNRTGTAYLPLEIYADDISFGVAGTIRMFINQSSGNVGIGTASPDEKLHINGSGGTEIKVENTDSNNWALFGMGTDNNVRAAYLLTYGSNHSTAGNHTALKNLWGDILFFTGTGGAGNTEKMRITSDGNVGIGTTSPLLTLHVNSSLGGGIRLESSSQKYGFISSKGNLHLSQNSYYNGTNWVTIETGTSGGFQTNVQSDEAFRVFSNTTSLTAESPITWNPLMVVKTDGKVGIGTTSPASILHISSTWDTKFIAGNQMDFTRDNVNYITASNASGSLMFGTGGRTNDVHIDSTGRVGIGTTSPSYKLDIKGDANAHAYMRIQSATAGYDPVLYFADSGGNEWHINYDDTDGTLKFVETGVADRVTFKDGGNVGIGTTTPIRKLDIYEDTAAGINQLEIENDGDGDASMLFTLTALKAWQVGIDNSDGDKFKINEGASLTWADTHFTIDTAGQVGIGTASPSSKLDVAGNFEVDGTDFFVNATSGYVGIGTTSPARQFQVEGSFPAFRLYDTTYDAYFEYLHSAGKIIFNEVKAGNYYSFQINSDEKMILKDNGDFEVDDDTLAVDGPNHRVGVGTKTPASALEVTGNITLSDANNCIIFQSGGKICSGV